MKCSVVSSCYVLVAFCPKIKYPIWKKNLSSFMTSIMWSIITEIRTVLHELNKSSQDGTWRTKGCFLCETSSTSSGRFMLFWLRFTKSKLDQCFIRNFPMFGLFWNTQENGYPYFICAFSQSGQSKYWKFGTFSPQIFSSPFYRCKWSLAATVAHPSSSVQGV